MCPTHTGEPLVGCAAFAGLRLAGCCLPLPKSTQIKMPQPLLTVSTLTYGCRALEGGATWRQRVRPRSTQAAPWAAATLAAAATVQQCPAHSALHAGGLALGLLYHTLKLQNMCNTLKIKCGIEAPATAGLPMRCGGAGSCAPYACAAASLPVCLARGLWQRASAYSQTRATSYPRILRCLGRPALIRG